MRTIEETLRRRFTQSALFCLRIDSLLILAGHIFRG
jgi:hypothetical protein